MPILIDAGGHPPAQHHLLQQFQVGPGGLGGAEGDGQHLPGGVVYGRHQAARGILFAEPPVGAAIPQHHQALGFLAGPAAAVLGGMVRALGRHSRSSPPAPHRLPTERDPLLLPEHLGEVRVVEVKVALLRERQHPRPQRLLAAVVRGPAPVAVAEPRQPPGHHLRLQPLRLPVAHAQGLPDLAQRQRPFHHFVQQLVASNVLPTHVQSLVFHAAFLPHVSHQGDIFAVHSHGDRIAVQLHPVPGSLTAGPAYAIVAPRWRP